MSLLAKLKEARAELETPADPSLAPLQRVRGKVELDDFERVSLSLAGQPAPIGAWRSSWRSWAGRPCACAT
jgi:hypothetical protein